MSFKIIVFRGGRYSTMFELNIYKNIIYLIVLCFSFLNFMFVFCMNKILSLFKLLGISFFTSLFLCIYLVLIPNRIPLGSIVSLSEICLALAILTCFIKSHDEGNIKLKAAAIFVVPLIIGLFIQIKGSFVFFSISKLGQAIITVSIIFLILVLIRCQRYSEKLLQLSLLLWGLSILLVIFENQSYIMEGIVILKLSSFALFFYYFFNSVYNSFMSKIVESERMKESLERSLNKEVKKRVFEIERSNERLLQMSKIDLLTKAYNKITILNIIDKIIISKKYEVFSIIMFDIDNFKTINDSLGHVTGDMCLKTLANIASNNIRELDFLGRYGGDEFLIILPSLSTNEAKFVAERVKDKVSETSNPKFTISVGIATYPYDGETVNELISAADRAMYKSKSKGKNMISHIKYF